MKDAGSIEMLSKFSLVNQFRAQRPSHRDERTARRIQATSRARSTAATSVSIHRLACLCLSLSLSSMLSRAFSPCLCLPCQRSTVEPGVLCVCCLPCSRRLPLPLPLALASRLRSWRACRVAESRHGSHGACREHPRAAEIHCSIFPSYFFSLSCFLSSSFPPPPPTTTTTLPLSPATPTTITLTMRFGPQNLEGPVRPEDSASADTGRLTTAAASSQIGDSRLAKLSRWAGT